MKTKQSPLGKSSKYKTNRIQHADRMQTTDFETVRGKKLQTSWFKEREKTSEEIIGRMGLAQ
jgi:hypothetical protein